MIKILTISLVIAWILLAMLCICVVDQDNRIKMLELDAHAPHLNKEAR